MGEKFHQAGLVRSGREQYDETSDLGLISSQGWTNS